MTYELAADIMSYFFAAIAVYIVARLAFSVLKEFSFARAQNAQGYSMGVLQVTRPEALMGQKFALRRENRIGRAGKCDVRLKDKSVRPVQAAIFQRGKQVVLSDYGNKDVVLNGQPLKGETPLCDGDRIAFGQVELLLGLKEIKGRVRRKAVYDEPEQELADPGGRYGSPATEDGEARDQYGQQYGQDWDEDGEDGDYDQDDDGEYDQDDDGEYGGGPQPPPRRGRPTGPPPARRKLDDYDFSSFDFDDK